MRLWANGSRRLRDRRKNPGVGPALVGTGGALVSFWVLRWPWLVFCLFVSGGSVDVMTHGISWSLLGPAVVLPVGAGEGWFTFVRPKVVCTNSASLCRRCVARSSSRWTSVFLSASPRLVSMTSPNRCTSRLC